MEVNKKFEFMRCINLNEEIKNEQSKKASFSLRRSESMKIPFTNQNSEEIRNEIKSDAKISKDLQILEDQ